MMKKWTPLTVVSPREVDSVLEALRINRPAYQYRKKKAGSMAGMFGFIRIERRLK